MDAWAADAADYSDDTPTVPVAPRRHHSWGAKKGFCSLATLAKIAFKFLFSGLCVGLACKYVPVYGSVISDHEVVVIALVAAVVQFVLEKVLPTFSVSVGGYTASGAAF